MLPRMPRPRVTSVRLATIARPASRDTQAAELRVDLRTLAPAGAPDHVRPRFVLLERVHYGGGVTGRAPLSTSIGVRRVELGPLLAALLDAARQLGVEVPGLQAGGALPAEQAEADPSVDAG